MSRPLIAIPRRIVPGEAVPEASARVEGAAVTVAARKVLQ